MRRAAPRDAAALRDGVRADLPDVDAAARSWTGLGADLPATRLRVVSRTGWVDANLAALRGAFDPLAEKLTSRPPLAAKALGVQIGALLGLLSTKVLGQYVLPLGRPAPGELLVVGPNLLDLDERFGRLAGDVRRSVLLHEVVHRLQFEAVPWLGDHLRGLLARYLRAARVDTSALLELAGDLPGLIRRVRETGSLLPVVERVLTSDQVEAIREAQGLMSLLEGHGNAAMYRGSAGLVEDPRSIRRALEERRGDVTTRLLSAVAGLDLKRRQYREGEAFVAAVVEEVGTAGLNRAFAAPGNLPGYTEIGEPAEWLNRVASGNGD